MRRYLSMLALSLGMAVTTPLPASALEIAVSPARFELDLDGKRKTQTLEIVNSADHPVKIGIDMANFDLDENNQLRVLPPTEQSLDQWIAINPTRVKIPAKGRRTMRFAIRPQVEPQPGEHRAVIFLNEEKSDQAEDGLRFKFRLGVVVYGQVGEANRTAQLHNVGSNQRGMTLDVQNTGNAHARFKGIYAVWNAASYPGDAAAAAMLQGIQDSRKISEDVIAPGSLAAGVVSETPVLPGTRRTVVQELPDAAKAGQRKVYLLGKLGDSPISAAALIVPEALLPISGIKTPKQLFVA